MEQFGETEGTLKCLGGAVLLSRGDGRRQFRPHLGGGNIASFTIGNAPSFRRVFNVLSETYILLLSWRMKKGASKHGWPSRKKEGRAWIPTPPVSYAYENASEVICDWENEPAWQDCSLIRAVRLTSGSGSQKQIQKPNRDIGQPANVCFTSHGTQSKERTERSSSSVYQSCLMNVRYGGIYVGCMSIKYKLIGCQSILT